MELQKPRQVEETPNAPTSLKTTYRELCEITEMLSEQESKLLRIVDNSHVPNDDEDQDGISNDLTTVTMDMIQNRINQIQRITSTNSKLLSKLIGN